MQKQAKRVIWKHPKGRFEVQETEHYSLFDHRTYYTRECVFTPQDDLRGLCSEVPAYDMVPEELKNRGRQMPRVTDEEKQQFAEMHRCGMPLRAIAKETGRSTKVISDALEKLGLRDKQHKKAGSWSEEELRKAVDMRKHGYLFREIGEELGKSRNAVQNKLTREELRR